MTSSTSREPGRLPTLDGLRAVAIALVLVGHGRRSMPLHGAWTKKFWFFFDNGHLGVLIFFVLSGFLITHLLKQEKTRTGKIHLGFFYQRRALRIFPAFYLFLACLAVLNLIGLARLFWPDFIFAGTYTWNYRVFSQGWNPNLLVDAFDPRNWYLGHLWTLSLEEQFYLVWPAALLFLGLRRAAAAALVILLLEPVLRIGAYFLLPSLRTSSPSMLPFALDPLMAGSLAALCSGERWFESMVDRYLKGWLVIASIIFLTILSPVLDSKFHGTFSLVAGLTMASLGILAILLWLLRHAGSRFGAFLEWKPVVMMGRLSYSLYLWQQLFLVQWHSGLWIVQRFPLNYVCCFGAALLSYHLIEKPFLRLKDRTRFSQHRLEGAGRRGNINVYLFLKLLHILMGAERGGCETDCLMICRELKEARQRVLIIGREGPMSEVFVATGAGVDHLNLEGGNWFHFIRPLRNQLEKNEPDGVIIWHGMVALPHILYTLRGRDIPILIHGGNPAYDLPLRVDWKFRILRLMLPEAPATYVCCSQFVSQSFERSVYLRAFPRTVVLNGVQSLDEASVHIPRMIERDDLLTIGMVARLDTIKDHATLLRAFAQVRKKRPAARLELAGDGALRGHLEKQARQLGLGESVRFLGMVSDVYGAMKNWDIFAYATTPKEGMGNALAEAMMLGLPCVASDLAPVREVAGTPPAIVLVPPGDAGCLARAMMDLADHPELRVRFGQSARKRAVAKLSARTFARHYFDLLRVPRRGNDEGSGLKNGRALKLLHILITLERGGCEGTSRMVCEGLREVEHQVLVVEGEGPMSADFAAAGAKITYLHQAGQSWFKVIPPLRAILDEKKPDGVIIWHGMVALPQFLYALRGRNIPVLVYGGNPAYTLPRLVDWKFRGLRLLLPGAPATYVCCSDYVAQSFDRSGYLRPFPREVVFNGVMPVDEAAIHHPRKIGQEEELTIGMVARLDRIKDHSTLLRAFAQLREKRPAARLELAGDGALRGPLEAEARQLGLGQSVRFLGMVNDVYGAMKNWDIFAFATTPEEGMGSALAEAMMEGLPCVASDLAPIREVAGMPPAVVLTPPGNPARLAQDLWQLANDFELRVRYSRAGRERAEKVLSTRVSAQRYADLLWPGGNPLDTKNAT
jgi:glycosyltransferase involved in cell wall biosynthesis